MNELIADELTNNGTPAQNIPMSNTILKDPANLVSTRGGLLYKRPYEEDSTSVAYWLEWLPSGKAAWDPTTDLRLFGFDQTKAGLEALGKFFAGEITGNGDLIITAPVETLFYEDANNTFGYAFASYKNDYLAKGLDGKDVLITVDDKWLPVDNGVARLFNDRGMLYSKPGNLFTVADRDGHMYWRCRAMRALLSGKAVRLTIWNEARQQAEADSVLAVYESVDPAAANAARVLSNKHMRNVNRGVQHDVTTAKVVEAVTGVAPVYEEKDYLVATTTPEKTVSLRDWPFRQPIWIWDTKHDEAMVKPIRLFEDTLNHRALTAGRMRKEGWAIDLGKLAK